MELYRFEKFEDRRVSAVANGQLWCSSPRRFGDLADCRLELSIQDIESVITEKITELARNGSLPNRLGTKLTENLVRLLEIKQKGSPSIVNMLGEGRAGLTLGDVLHESWLIADIREHIVDTTAVCCFVAGHPLNPLMWTHYADNNHGFCVGYYADMDEQEASKQMFAVNYMTERLPITPEELMIAPNLAIKRVTASKDNVWAYEKEYRMVLPNDLRGDQKGKGRIVSLPRWLQPIEIFSGALLENDKDIAQLDQVASSLGIMHRRVRSRNGRLALDKCADDKP